MLTFTVVLASGSRLTVRAASVFLTEGGRLVFYNSDKKAIACFETNKWTHCFEESNCSEKPVLK